MAKLTCLYSQGLSGLCRVDLKKIDDSFDVVIIDVLERSLVRKIEERQHPRFALMSSHPSGKSKPNGSLPGSRLACGQTPRAVGTTI